MVVKVYISGISGNKEVKKRQQRVLMILDSKSIKYDVIDITEPGREADKDFMQNNSKASGGTVSDPNPRSPLPPQVFNDDEYCGDYDQFDMANEVDTLEQFLGLEVPPDPSQIENGQAANHTNGDVSGMKASSKESSQEKDNIETKISSSKEASPAEADKAGTPGKDSTPAPESIAEETSEKEVKEPSAERQESAPIESKKSSKESTPAHDEAVVKNGSNSRAQSVEKGSGDEVKEIKTPSEALIESEQAVSAE